MTIRDHIMTLPDGYRELALKYEKRLHLRSRSLMFALAHFAHWENTNEGEKFWDEVYDHFAIGTPLPPLPKQLP